MDERNPYRDNLRGDADTSGLSPEELRSLRPHILPQPQPGPREDAGGHGLSPEELRALRPQVLPVAPVTELQRKRVREGLWGLGVVVVGTAVILMLLEGYDQAHRVRPSQNLAPVMEMDHFAPELGGVVASEERIAAALARADRWLDRTEPEIDPVALHRRGIKGKKKLVELLDAHVTRWRTTRDADARAALEGKIRRLVAHTERDAYHDLAQVSDKEFRQSSLSYLRACYLMEEVGLDTARYRARIDEIKPRLDAHLSARGVDQRMSFHLYYQSLGLAEPLPLASAFDSSITKRRVPPLELDGDALYQLTHEVFAAFGYGRLTEPLFMDPNDLEYVRHALSAWMGPVVRHGDPDLAAELVMALHMTGGRALPGFDFGVRFLLHSQKPDGSWGNFEAKRPQFGDYVRVIWELHTTGVAVKALSYAMPR